MGITYRDCKTGCDESGAVIRQQLVLMPATVVAGRPHNFALPKLLRSANVLDRGSYSDTESERMLCASAAAAAAAG